MKKYPKRYIPDSLSSEDKKKQSEEIEKSKKAYKEGKYHNREKIDSFESHTSNHITNAKHIYEVESITASEELSKKSGCSIETLQKIIKKGEGAFYSSGSRPNQTAQSWGKARLASALTGGKAAAVDFSILEKGCDHSGVAYTMALSAKKKYGSGKGPTPKTEI